MRKNRVLAGLLAAVMLLGTVPAALAAEVPVKSTAITYANGIQLDKTVANTNLNLQTKQSEITLSVKPTGTASDPVVVEFVLDATESMVQTVETDDGYEVPAIDAWAEAIYNKLANRNIYVGITAFGKEAEAIYTPTETLTGRPKVTVNYKNWLENNLGTNLQAGIRSGLANMNELAEAVGAAKADRYLVLVTDGGTYWRLDGDKAVNDTVNGKPMMNQDAAELATYGYQLVSGGDLEALIGAAPEVSEKDYTVEPSTSVYADTWSVMRPERGTEMTNYTNFEKGVYAAYTELASLSGVKLATIGSAYYPEKGELKQLTDLAAALVGKINGKSLYHPDELINMDETTTADFDQIITDLANAILSVRKGSTIVDTMGEGKDSKEQEYDFDLDVSQPITLTINGESYVGTKNDNTWTFRDGSKLVYTPETDGKADFFTFTLGQDLKLGDTMTLVYTAKAVTTGNANGNHNNLLTNVSAVLQPAGTKDELEFPLPVVSYTIQTGPRPEIIPEEKIPLADLNTVDHYSYIIGYKDGNVMPYGTITRGEVATIFFRLLSDATRDQYWCQTNNYSDCDENLWCNNAISTLTNLGIIDGYTDGTFRPYAKITRAQFAKIAVGFFQTTKQDYKGYFYDVAEGAWYAGYVEAAARISLIMGFEDGTFRPNTNITRAQACVIVNRAIDRKPDIDHLLDEDDMITWPDNDPSAWYYADIQEATNSHDYKWIAVDVADAEDPTFPAMEEWTAKLPQRDWAAFEHAWSTSHSAPGGEVKDISSKN